MTIAIREQILAAFFVKLEALNDVIAFRNRDTNVGAEQMPAVIQRDGGMARAYDGNNLLNISMRIDVECYVKSTTDDAIGTAISDLYARVTQGVLDDITLGGLTIDMIESDDMMGDPIIARDQSDTPHAAFILSFTAQFFLKPGDPYSSAPA
jgi:hypothetical protein